MRTTLRAVLAAIAALTACDRARQLPPGAEAPVEVAAGDPTGASGGGTVSVVLRDCTRCHGTQELVLAGADPLVAAAPPRALTGDGTDPAVGAHRAHLVQGPLANAMECASCHLVPTPSRHQPQRQGKVSFSRLATTAWTGARLAPTWDGTTCASTYCHGAFRNGSAGNAPSWTGGAAQAGCGSCHGIPPAGSHPQDAPGAPLDCSTCHPGYTRTSVNLATHVNGRLDVGNAHQPGWIEPDQHGLAALAQHLDPCATCHSGYGAAAGAGTSCDGCHADPSVYGPYATGTYPPHPDWKTECTFCHGGRDNASGAPPRNTHVISSDSGTAQATADATIGAHTSHVGTAATSPTSLHGLATGLDCTACHPARWASALDPGHADAATADVLFNPVGATANPGSYARPSCASTYCHGNFRGGAGTGAVSWTGDFGGAATLSCTSCHAAPPATSATVPHPPNPSCGACHAGYTATAVNATMHVNGAVDHAPTAGCTQCHGDLGAPGVPSGDVRAAPAGDASAVDAHGNPASSTAARGVGAHASHLTGTRFRATAIACAECHAVPPAGDTTHADGSATVGFGALATTAWAGQPPIAPAWNGAGGAATLTCASTYCHGAFKNGANAAPAWTAIGSVGCGSCHGIPPPGHNPAKVDCGSCHGGSYAGLTLDRTLHMNGVLDLGNLSCSSCHGDDVRTPVASATALDALGANLVLASPPADAGHGATATGAHLAHVNQGDAAAPGALSSAIACTACHLVPITVGHSTGIAEVTFGGVATAAGATPAPYDRAGHGCASTYCHGAFPGGNGASPIAWTATGKLACNACHGAPPGPTSATLHHPPNPACASCHPGFTGGTVDSATHVDGTIQHAPATGCTQCHGDLGASGVASADVRAAPGGDASAVDAHGNPAASTAARGVGTHASHLTGTRWRATPIACSECHAVPGGGDTAHADGNPALAFGALARTAWPDQPAIAPAWNGAGGAPTLTCSSTYCHGAFKNGARAAPTWTAAGSVACGDCHAVIPGSGAGGTHPSYATTRTCGDCHGGSYTNGAVDGSLHMNGFLDVPNLRCSSCHGDDRRTPVASATAIDALGANLVLASPPADAGHGAAATGAHLAHVNQGDTAAPGALSSAIACAACHAVPTSVGHADGTVGVTFDGLATAAGASPAPYDLAGHGCASTYCHGAFAGGNGASPIAWTSTGKLACDACHGAPPGPTSATLHHPPNPACGSCHPGYTATTVSVTTHVDGAVQHAPATGCTQCHGDLTVADVANTDIRAAPAGDAAAVDAHGNPATSTSARGVGTHAKHLGATTWRGTPIACGECHAVPVSGDTSHVTGSAAVTFGALASTAWPGQPAITPAWNGAGGGSTLTCASTYCHGAFPNGANASPTWTAAGSVACGSCHGVSPSNGPGGTHPTLSGRQDCGSCHGGSYTNTSVDPALHMNGQLDGGGEPASGGATCGGCHDAIFAAMNGTLPHATRHALGAVEGTNDSPVDSGLIWANPLSSNAAAARSCVNMCHGDHPHDLASPATATHENNAYLDATSGATRADGAAARIGVGGTGGAPNRTKTDYDGAQANGGLCASCHRNPVSPGRPAVDRAAFDASAHDFGANTAGGTTYTWRYTLHDGGAFVRDCTKCHASRTEGTTPTMAAAGSATAAVHFGDEAALLAGTIRPAGNPAGFVCYNCHGSAAAPAAGAQGDRSGKGVQTQIAHATTTGQSGHPADSDAVHDSVAEQANASFGNALGVAAGAGQRHASCLDCHDPHEARAGAHAPTTNLAGPPLQGAWGARLSSYPPFWTAPTSASFTKTTIAAGTDLEATLCFKCHSSFYGTLPAAPSGGYAETDTAREFNPNNAGNWATAGTANAWSSGESAGGFHPVLASAGNTLGRINLANLVTTSVAWSTTARNLMTCTDCHESDQATDPNGPHGSAAGFILRGPNVLWNGTLAATSTGMPAGTFCANCHSPAYASSRNSTQHTRLVHQQIACWSCHARIPHGGPRPGMLVAPAGAAPEVGGTIAGWDDAAPYSGNVAAGGYKLGIASYPTSASMTWSRSNCGCDAATPH